MSESYTLKLTRAQMHVCVAGLHSQSPLHTQTQRSYIKKGNWEAVSHTTTCRSGDASNSGLLRVEEGLVVFVFVAVVVSVFTLIYFVCVKVCVNVCQGVRV